LLTKEDPNYEMDSFDYFFQQLVCNYEFKSFPQKLLWVIDSLKERKDIASLLLLFKKLKIKKLNGSSEPLDIFFLN
jgi:hypothetical protein